MEGRHLSPKYIKDAKHEFHTKAKSITNIRLPKVGISVSLVVDQTFSVNPTLFLKLCLQRKQKTMLLFYTSDDLRRMINSERN